MDILGWLAWWSVGSVELTPTDAEQMMGELGLDIPPPAAVLPIDAFRRLTGSTRREYELPDGSRVTLDLHPAQAQSTMLVRHIVRTVKKEGVNVSIKRVGEAVFYKPARGKPRSARMRVQVGATDDPEVRRFGDELRPEYEKALTTLDDQAARRLVRSFLLSVDALPMGGPYLLAEDDAERLQMLFDRLGGTCRCDTIAVADTVYHRSVIDAWRKEVKP